ncbi:hypothetical protein GDO81_002409 [Engystomops pustulosus]|uniref:Uncharacterized protein n=1 Tax=Engystomops pustulosus TaxID=76066 RepID=A0AAV7DK30_ENGPU|nr:hypothetical protein GDO81_002409 [Engystomops pustulosus]
MGNQQGSKNTKRLHQKQERCTSSTKNVEICTTDRDKKYSTLRILKQGKPKQMLGLLFLRMDQRNLLESYTTNKIMLKIIQIVAGH